MGLVLVILYDHSRRRLVHVSLDPSGRELFPLHNSHYMGHWINLSQLGGICGKVERSGWRRFKRWWRQTPGPWTESMLFLLMLLLLLLLLLLSSLFFIMIMIVVIVICINRSSLLS